MARRQSTESEIILPEIWWSHREGDFCWNYYHIKNSVLLDRAKTVMPLGPNEPDDSYIPETGEFRLTLLHVDGVPPEHIQKVIDESKILGKKLKKAFLRRKAYPHFFGDLVKFHEHFGFLYALALFGDNLQLERKRLQANLAREETSLLLKRWVSILTLDRLKTVKTKKGASSLVAKAILEYEKRHGLPPGWKEALIVEDKYLRPAYSSKLSKKDMKVFAKPVRDGLPPTDIFPSDA